jgi:hypothetical protein
MQIVTIVTAILNVAVLFVLVSGCGAMKRQYTRWTGELSYKCSKSGVEYVQSDSGLAVHVNQLGFPVKCEKGE